MNRDLNREINKKKFIDLPEMTVYQNTWTTYDGNYYDYQLRMMAT